MTTWYNVIYNFIFLVLSMFLIRKTSNLLSNITTVLLSIGIPYVQLSLNLEVLFMLVLVITLACLRKIVTQSADSSQALWTQWRHAFFFVSETHSSVSINTLTSIITLILFIN